MTHFYYPSFISLSLLPRYALGSLLFAPIARVMLLVMGFNSINRDYADLRKLRIKSSTSRAEGSFGSGVSSRDIIVCNHSSFVEVLFLVAVFVTPTFGVVNQDGSVTVVNTFTALSHSTKTVDLVDVAGGVPLSSVVSSGVSGWFSSGPLILFPEGARTNGKGILRFLPLFDAAASYPDVHIVAFKYSGFSAPHTTGSALHHLWSLCLQLDNTMSATFLHSDDIKKDADTSSAATSSAASLSLSDKIRKLLATILGVKQVDLSVSDFVAFNKFYVEHYNSKASSSGGGKRRTKRD
jgi:1-acyl-sn-glycerol-3-phosphate acyltransferase